MPPRKSDQRKSDASVARFALKDDLPEASPSAPPAPSPAAADTSTISSAPAPPSTSASAADAHDGSHDKKDAKDKDAMTIEDLTLPKSIITRLAKGVLPANTQIQANAVLAMSKSTTVFVNYLASYANEHTTNAGKKTIVPGDVFKALDDIEFGFLRERLEAEYAKFNAIQTEKRTSYRNKVKAAKQDPNASNAGDTSMADTTLDNTTLTTAEQQQQQQPSPLATAGGDAPRAKKQRVDPSASVDEEQDDAETEDEQPLDEDEDMQDDDVEEEEEEEKQGSGDETQDGLEERDVGGREERDEALDGDESD